MMLSLFSSLILNKKALTAINEHFDSDCHEIPNIEMEDCMYGRTGEINVKVDFDNDNDYIATVFVKQVFIY